MIISRRDGECIHDWRVMQRIKNCVAGEDREAVEIYPAESRVLDAGNYFHLWVMPIGQKVPFGFDGRLVVEASKENKRQRPFGDMKPMLVPLEEVQRRVVGELKR